MGTIPSTPGRFPRGGPALIFCPPFADLGLDRVDEPLICSARGCREPAAWALSWNNPKLHTPDRRKTWLACAAHRDHLSAFLRVRGFLRDVTEVR